MPNCCTKDISTVHKAGISYPPNYAPTHKTSKLGAAELWTEVVMNARATKEEMETLQNKHNEHQDKTKKLQ